MTRRLLELLFTTMLLVALAGWSAPAAAQAGEWVQCVARSPSSGALYIGEPIDSADRTKATQYRAEFIKAGQASGVAAGELNAQTAFCFFAPRQEDLGRMVADLGKPCPSCSAPYRQAPVAWNIRDILPAEIAAAGSHLITLALSEPPPPPPPTPAPADGGAPTTPPAETPAPAPPPERYPIASARWQAFVCGTEVRVSYAFEAPAGSPIESVPFQGVVSAGGGITRPFDLPLSKTSTATPGCGSAQFLKVADLTEFLKDLPPRGDARLAALRQRLEDVTLQIAPPPPPPPPPVVVEVPPAKAPVGRNVRAAPGIPNKAPAAPSAIVKTAPVVQAPVATPLVKDATSPSVPAQVAVRPSPPAAPEPVPAAEDTASARLNAEVANRNAEVASRNAAAAADYQKRMADYKAAQDAFAASQAAYERRNKEHEAQVAEAARARAAWEAKVKACSAGDRAACAQ